MSALSPAGTSAGSAAPGALVNVLHVVTERVVALLGEGHPLLAADALLEQCDPLSEDLGLVGQPRHRHREVQQEDEDECERDEEQGVRRISDTYRVADGLQQATPEREAEEHDCAEQPQECVALEQPPATHQLEDDHEHRRGRHDGDDLDPELHQIPCSAATGALSPGSTTGRRRARPTKSASSTLTM